MDTRGGGYGISIKREAVKDNGYLASLISVRGLNEGCHWAICDVPFGVEGMACLDGLSREVVDELFQKNWIVRPISHGPLSRGCR
ncbi:hypothetical protein JTE90_023325 [Oedothorax gibbosus]|uniref:Uncharacterized protein n=1 Tax=Oedothorax gibbosus TaxID=931172 RepID=A0AAV6VGG2_9ARAC|nr:hypothetical protein JTE90_023325 [Oedothorax gibbosus]